MALASCSLTALLNATPASCDKTDAIVLASETMGDRAAHTGGSAGDDQGAGEILRASHYRLCMVSFTRSYRLDVNNGRPAIRRAIFAPHLRHDRQLQYGCSLPRAKISQQDNLAVWKLDGVVVPARVFHVHLPKTRDPATGIPFPEESKDGAAPLDIMIEREFGARLEADRYRRRIDGCEAARGSA